MADDLEALTSSPVQTDPDPLTSPLDDVARDLDAHPELDGDTDRRAREYVRRYIVEKAIPEAQLELAREYDQRGELVVPSDDERITLDTDEIKRDIASNLGEFGLRNADWLDGIIADTLTEPFGKAPDPVRPNQPGGGDPVLLAQGEFVYQNDDFRVAGAGIDFVFRRTYRNQAVVRGPLGVNWDHHYDVLLWASDDRVVLTSGELRQYEYLRHPRYGQDGFSYYVPPDGEHSIVLAEDDSFVRRSPEGVRHVFAPDEEWPGGHRLARIEDRYGNHLTFSYASGRIDAVLVNHPERVVRFAYDDRGRIRALSDHTGRQWRYGYDDLGNLSHVGTPPTDDHPYGLVTRYDYRVELPPPFAHDLVRIVDPAGRTYLENDYGAEPGYHDFNRVVRQRHGGGETLWQYEEIELEHDYPPEQQPVRQTNEIDPCGHAVHHVYNAFNNLLLREERVGPAERQRLLRWRYRYNADGEVTASLSPEGVLTQYLYGREVFRRRHGADDADVRGHDAMTAAERLGFGRVLAVVRRAVRIAFPHPASLRVWGDGFPDVLGAPDPDDVVVKLTYEPDYGQLASRSDPRATERADPDHVEPPAHAALLSHYEFTGPPDDPHLLLAAVHHPEPTDPTGAPAGPVVTRYLAHDERGRALRMSDPVGTVTEFTYYGAADGVREGFLRRAVLDPGGLALTTEYEIDDLGRTTAIRSPRAREAPPGRFVTRHRYNALDQLTAVISSPPFEDATRYAYDAAGLVTRIETDARDHTGADLPGGPRVHTYRFDEGLTLRAETIGGKDERAHLVTAHRYDAAARLASTVLPGGNRIDYRYDQRHRMTAMTIGVGSQQKVTTRTDYDGDDLPVAVISGRGAVTTSRYDTFGRAVETVDPLGTVTRRTYDRAGNPTVERVFEHRAGGHVLLARSDYRYDELNRPIELARNRFDEPIPVGDLDEFTDPPGPGERVVTNTTYDAAGHVVATTDPLGRVQRFAYDAGGRLVVETDALGHRVEHRYDAHGNRIRRDVRERVGDTGTPDAEEVFSSAWTYDELDRPSSATDGLGSTTTALHDSFGNVTELVDPLGHVVHAEFDLLGRQFSVSDATSTVRFGHDRNGNLVTVTDALGRTTTRGFDALDQLAAVEYPDGRRTAYDHDADGALAGIRQPNGAHRRFQRDAAGRVRRITVQGPHTVEGARTVEFTHDGLGRLTSAGNDVVRTTLRIDSLGRSVAERHTFLDPPLHALIEVARDHDAGGSVVGRGYPGGRRVRVVRDELDRPVRIENVDAGTAYPGGPAPDPVVASLSYRGRRPGRIQAGAGTTEWAFDGAGRPIVLRHHGAGRALLALGHVFDAVGNLRLRTDRTPTGTSTEVFGYDDRNRLISVSAPQQPVSIDDRGIGPATAPTPDPIPRRQDDIDRQLAALPAPAGPTWILDATDNRVTEQRPGRPPATYRTNVLDQYERIDATPLVSDASGNLVSDGRFGFGYDGWDRLSSVTDAGTGETLARYLYDALGRRVVEIVDGVVTHLVHDQGQLVAEYRDGVLDTQYVYGDALDRPIRIATGGAEFSVHSDLVGSVRLLVDAQGRPAGRYAFGPFGEPAATTGRDIAPGFAGRRRDRVTGDYDFRLRQYRPALGRFVQRDPLELVDGTNLYGYAGHNPLVFLDPTGAAAERATPGAPTVPDTATGSTPTSVAPPTENGPAPATGGAPPVLLPADQWVEPKREPEPTPSPGPEPPDQYFGRLVYNAEQWARSSDDDYRALRRGAAFLAELVFGLPLAVESLQRARDDEGVQNSFADRLDESAARAASPDQAARLRAQAGRLRLDGLQATQAAALGVVVAAVTRGRGRPVTRKVKRFQGLGFQDHHIFTNKTTAVEKHPIWAAAGRDPDTRFNKMLLPSRAELHPARSIHIGRHDRGLIKEQARLLDDLYARGKAANWTPAQFDEALLTAIKTEKRLLVSGHRRLNKNHRPWAGP